MKANAINYSERKKKDGNKKTGTEERFKQPAGDLAIMDREMTGT